MTEPVELVVVGAGPAGIQAAITASRARVEVTLLDTLPKPGGQYFKQIPDALLDKGQSHNNTKGQQLIRQLGACGVRIFHNTLVWGIFEGWSPETWCLKLYGPDEPRSLLARKVILATGAYDRSIPFPGWNLPGVITAGAALTMCKFQGVLPGRRIVLSGTGPLQLAAAAHLVRAGAEVVGICESATSLIKRSTAYLPAIWGQWARMLEGIGYIRTLTSARVPYHLGWSVVSTQGEDRVSRATIAKLDQDSRPIPQTEISLDVDAVVVGYNLTPGTELCRLVDCKHEFNAGRGGFVPQRSVEMETSCPGIYAVGDCAGIGGAEMAMIEGRIAGYAVAAKLACLSEQSASSMIFGEEAALRREQRFAGFLGDVFSPAAGLYTLADPDTIICRCEQVTLGQIREAIAFGAQTVSDVKNLVRTGMGNCQGRTCGSVVAQILAAETGRRLEEVGYFSMRSPIHPLPLEVIEESLPEDNQSGQGVLRT
jgi:NADPH-dependent 2,4-dienoyl-CoA reductase/sulfur reductase-like enzyme